MPPDLKALAAKARGLASSEIVKDMTPGAVFIARDPAIQFPESRLEGAGTRDIHATRRVIVVQARELNARQSPKTLLVVPCSASSTICGEWDFEIPDGENAFDKPKVVAYASLVQPILKRDLEKFVGNLTDGTLRRLQQIVARNLGLIQGQTLPLPEPLALTPGSEESVQAPP